MEKTIEKLISGNDVEFTDSLLEFIKSYEGHLTFNELNRDGLRRRVWESLFNHLEQAKYFTVHQLCLQALRILSRDKTDLNDLITRERLNVVIQNAELYNVKQVERKSWARNSEVPNEALKLLCNLMYNSTSVQETIGETTCLECVVKRMSLYSNDVPHEIKLFDTRVLFLATALNAPLRHVVCNRLNGTFHLVLMLEKLALKCQSKISLTEEDVALACEVLKVLFNLYINTDESKVEEKDREKNLVNTLYELLVNGVINNAAKQEELQSNIINLLTVMPYGSYDSLIRPSRNEIDGETIYQNTDMRAVARLLTFLDQRLEMKRDSIEDISPVITALIRLVKSQRLIRKYVRLQVLPPLKDVMKRPEEGSSLRAKLCKLLTCPQTELCDLVAEFIFVLCKENASRMVKYTGYGNAAGMFANKGLLGRGQPSHSSSAYSSESEDSDTEEYVRYKENINPVTGCYEHPKPNPLAGMTEEQKEYEAMKLVGLVDQLTRQGIVQPCRIGHDGKPKPIEHILELQEELPKLNVNSDKDD